MIRYEKGDFFASSTEAIVNTVNCVGVIGRGISSQFKTRHPDNFAYYEAACKRNEVVPGKMLVYDRNCHQNPSHQNPRCQNPRCQNPRYIINFPTKQHWREASRIDYIEMGLRNLVDVINALNIKSISVPPLGCGLGGLEWIDVKPLLETAFEQLSDVNVNILEPRGALPATGNGADECAL